MKIPFGSLTVYFPYDYVYPEQYDYMLSLKQTLDTGSGHCLLEMPTGTGKTVSLLSLIVSYQLSRPEVGKLVYCTRTVQEMDKVMQEIKRVFKYIDSEKEKEKEKEREEERGHEREHKKRRRNLCVCLSSRRNLCIHERVSKFDDARKIDSLCRTRTASWIRASASAKTNHALCAYYEGLFDVEGAHLSELESELCGIFSLYDLKELGRARGWCPYFVSRHVIAVANIVVYNYQYLLDPKIANLVSAKLSKDCVVVFDEAHNIDNICIEALSVRIDKRVLHAANRNLAELGRKVRALERTDMGRLNAEYQALVQGLMMGERNENENENDNENENELIHGAPVLSSELMREAIPGNIRKAKHFLNFVRVFVEHLRAKMNVSAVSIESSVLFVNRFRNETRMRAHQIAALRFAHTRLQSLFRTLRIPGLDRYAALSTIANLASLIASYDAGFQVLVEPYDNRTPHLRDPLLRLVCTDASIAMKPVLDKFRHVVITSGTLSPMSFYIRILGIERVRVARSFEMTLSRNCICPLIVSKGNDQIALSSKYELRDDLSVVKNYGELLARLAQTVPDGVVCFFTSYAYMEEMVCAWSRLGLLEDVMRSKLIFIETRDVLETSLALSAFKKACDHGRGAIFLSVARGKVAEGIDFDRHYGRCVVLFGVPFQYSRCRVLQMRLEFMKSRFQISEHEYLAFDALRQAAQCVGRVIRSKLDYGLMVLADCRYAKADKRRKLPLWLRHYLRTEYLALSTDVAVDIAAKFVKRMAQKHNKADEIGKSLLALSHIQRKLKHIRKIQFQKQNSNLILDHDHGDGDGDAKQEEHANEDANEDDDEDVDIDIGTANTNSNSNSNSNSNAAAHDNDSSQFTMLGMSLSQNIIMTQQKRERRQHN